MNSEFEKKIFAKNKELLRFIQGKSILLGPLHIEDLVCSLLLVSPNATNK